MSWVFCVIAGTQETLNAAKTIIVGMCAYLLEAQMGKIEKALTSIFCCLITMAADVSPFKNVLYILNANIPPLQGKANELFKLTVLISEPAECLNVVFASSKGIILKGLI